MSETPDRIYAWLSPKPSRETGGWNTDPTMRNVPYIRQDAIDKALRTARVEAILDVETVVRKRLAVCSNHSGMAIYKAPLEGVLADLRDLLISGGGDG